MSTNENEEQWVECPDCAVAQLDMGKFAVCQNCGFGPMPYYDEEGAIVQDC